VRRAHAAALEGYHSARFMEEVDRAVAPFAPDAPARHLPSTVPEWAHLYAELTEAPEDPSERRSREERRARGGPAAEYETTVVARAVRLWLTGRRKRNVNQSEIVRETGLPRTVVRRIGRMVDEGGFGFDSRGRLLLGNGTAFRAAGDAVSLRELETELGLEPFA
jgi:hypothetical protein